MTQTETDQQTITEQETFGATIAVDDLLRITTALEPFDTAVKLEFDHDHVSVAVVDRVNVLATRVTEPIDAPHAREIAVESSDLIDAVDKLRWVDDDTRLEVDDDDNVLRIYDGDENARIFEGIDLESAESARAQPDIDSMLDHVEWDVVAECDAWRLAGALWTAAAPADRQTRLVAGNHEISVEGDVTDFDTDSNDFVSEWLYHDMIEADVERRPGVAGGAECRVSEHYVITLVETLPLGGRLEVRFGGGIPLYVSSDEGVELVLAPRFSDDDTEEDGDE